MSRFTLEEQREIEIERARRSAGTKTTQDKRCGTVAGYFAHRRRKERTCLDCREAWAADTKARRKRQR